MPKQSAGTIRLLERGSASYLEALRELRGFRREVVSRSQAALKSRVDKLSRALGLKTYRGDVGYYEAPSLEPDAGGWEEVFACLTANLWLSLNCAFYVGLEWERKAKTKKVEVLATALIRIKSDKFGRYWKKLQTSAPDLQTDGKSTIFLREACAPNEIANFQGKLEQMLDRWCVIWRKTGGFAAIPKIS